MYLTLRHSYNECILGLVVDLHCIEFLVQLEYMQSVDWAEPMTGKIYVIVLCLVLVTSNNVTKILYSHNN